MRRIHDGGFDQVAKHGFHRGFPARLHVQDFAQADTAVQAVACQPFLHGTFFLPECGVLQGFERGQAAASGFAQLAGFGQFALQPALLFLQRQQRLLAFFQHVAERVQAGALQVVVGSDAFQFLRQCIHVQCGAFGGEGFSAALTFQRLPVQVFDLGAFDFGRARGFRAETAVLVPFHLPLRQRVFDLAQRFLAGAVITTEQGQLRLGFGDLQCEGFAPGFVLRDVFGQCCNLVGGFGMGFGQTFAQFALVPDLLFNPRDIRTDAVAFALRLRQAFGGLAVLLAAQFDLRFGLALLGNQSFEPGFLLRDGFAQRDQLAVQLAVFQRLELGFLDALVFLVLLVLLGLAGLAFQMLKLLVNFFAQVIEAIKVFASVTNALFGFLAALLVFGDAGGLFQEHAQFFGPGLDDLADHALLDDRIAARPKTGAQEQVGDVAAAATGAVEVVAGLAVAADQALDRDFVEGGVFASQGAVAVVEDQFDRGLPDRFARGRTGKDHIGQRVATQAAGR